MVSEKKRLEAVVHGMVQGVGFRWYARQMGRQLNLTGYVRNRHDGTVEVVAQGSEQALREFLSYLEAGPPAAVVQGVDVKWLPGGGSLYGFEVRF